MTSRTPAPTPDPECADPAQCRFPFCFCRATVPQDPVTLAEDFLTDKEIWPLGANSMAQKCVRGFAQWLRLRQVKMEAK